MKTFKLTFILLAVMAGLAPVTETKAQNVSVSVDFNTFYQELSPYGRWMNNPSYGQVWICDEPGFKPYYTNGHWDYTNYGWSWESDYDWGWAPFHYGRWEYDPYYGWMWIPGYEWASAWVSWSSYDDYYGWAPLGYGLGINISFGSVPYNRWYFVPRRNICEPNITRYCVPHYNNNNFRRAVVINNYYYGGTGVGRYFRGPERRDAERYTSNRIQERRIDYNDGFRNRRGSYARNNNNWNRDNRRYNEGANQNSNRGWGNNRRRDDVNNAPASNGLPGNRWDGNRNNRPERRQADANTRNNNDGENGNFPRRRGMEPGNNNTGTPPVFENRRPQREANPSPQTNENNNPGRRWNRGNDQQNNYPQQQQRYERQRPQVERPFPQQQQSAPQAEQRRMERRSDNGNGNWGGGRNMQQRSDDNNQRGAGRSERRRNG